MHVQPNRPTTDYAVCYYAYSIICCPAWDNSVYLVYSIHDVCITHRVSPSIYCIVYHPLIIPTNYHPLHNGMTDGWLHGAPLWRELFRIIRSPVLLYGVNYSELFSALWSTIHILAHSDGSLCGTTAACEVTMTICERLEEVLSDQIRQIFSYLFLQCIIIIIIIKNIYNWH